MLIKWRKIIIVSMAFILGLGVLAPAISGQSLIAGVTGPNLDVRSAILLDVRTGQVLYENNADQLFPPASMAKMMTEYLVFEHIEKGVISWDNRVSASSYAASTIGSRVLLDVGETFTVRELFMSIAVESANDASIALAEYIAGSEEEFSHMMNQKAREMGLSDNARFINSTGLDRNSMGEMAPSTLPGETMISARDAAIIAYYLVTDFPHFSDFTSQPYFNLRERETTPWVNRNWMLEGFIDSTNLRSFVYEGMDGLKTGYTREAQYCFTGTAERNGMRLISVVMGTETERARFEETRKLMDFGFNTFEYRSVMQAKQTLEDVSTVPVLKSLEYEVDVVTSDGVEFIVPKSIVSDDITIDVEVFDDDVRTAPIASGEILGEITVSYGSQVQVLDLVAAEDIEKAGWFRLFMRAIGEFISGFFQGLADRFGNTGQEEEI